MALTLNQALFSGEQQRMPKHLAMFHAREKNAGWRIDYFLVSRSIADKIGDSIIHPEIMGSDHCPVELDIF